MPRLRYATRLRIITWVSVVLMLVMLLFLALPARSQVLKTLGTDAATFLAVPSDATLRPHHRRDFP
jgi:hypothetical protein